MQKKNGKRLFWLALGYIAGGLVASMYGKKSGVTLRKDVQKARESGEGSFKVLVDNFISTHANMIDSIKEDIMTEENMEMYNEYKEDLLELLDSYKNKASVLLRDLKKKGESYLGEAKLQLKVLYDEKILEINKMKTVAPKKLQELKRKLKLTFDEIQDEMEELVK